MKNLVQEHSGLNSLSSIFSHAGGQVVGRTRLQKIAYLLHISGLDDSFSFEYKHYGPFSQDLARTVSLAKMASVISEQINHTSWGGYYSTFTSEAQTEIHPMKKQLIDLVLNEKSVVLELAATAAFLTSDFEDPWTETSRRKPTKASDENLNLAKSLYTKLQVLQTPVRLPELV